jgi:hypothetical protein
MGYRVFGSIYVIGMFGRYFSFRSPGCERFDFRLIGKTKPGRLSWKSDALRQDHP